jgi:hypothetical protein
MISYAFVSGVVISLILLAIYFGHVMTKKEISFYSMMFAVPAIHVLLMTLTEKFSLPNWINIFPLIIILVVVLFKIINQLRILSVSIKIISVLLLLMPIYLGVYLFFTNPEFKELSALALYINLYHYIGFAGYPTEDAVMSFIGLAIRFIALIPLMILVVNSIKLYKLRSDSFSYIFSIAVLFMFPFYYVFLNNYLINGQLFDRYMVMLFSFFSVAYLFKKANLEREYYIFNVLIAALLIFYSIGHLYYQGYMEDMNKKYKLASEDVETFETFFELVPGNEAIVLSIPEGLRSLNHSYKDIFILRFRQFKDSELAIGKSNERQELKELYDFFDCQVDCTYDNIDNVALMVEERNIEYIISNNNFLLETKIKEETDYIYMQEINDYIIWKVR